MPLTDHNRTRLGLWALLAAYGVVLYILIGAVPGGSDSSGYFNEARLFSHLTTHEPTRALTGIPVKSAPLYLYVPLGYKPAPDGSGQLVPTYSPGLPLMLVPAAAVAGWGHAGDLVLLLHSLAGLALTYILGRKLGLSRSWSLAGTVLLAASPLYLFMSLWAMSDVPAMVWTAAAVIAAWKCRDRPSWALASGLCAGVAFLIRPTNFLIAVPMLIVIGPSPRRLLLTAVGGLPGFLVWAAINHAAYGSYLQSGYGAVGNEFHSSLVPITLRFCARWLPLVLSPVVVASPLLLLLIRSRTRVTLTLCAWAAAFIGFYAYYRWTHEDWWFLRFLLPAAPALILGGLIALQRGVELARGTPSSMGATLLLVTLLAAGVVVELTQIRPLHAWSIGHGERKYGRIADLLNARIPANSVIIAKQFSGAAYSSTHFILIRSDELGGGTAQRVRAAAKAEGRQVYCVVFPVEPDSPRQLPGKWEKFGSVEDITIWKSDWGD